MVSWSVYEATVRTQRRRAGDPREDGDEEEEAVVIVLTAGLTSPPPGQCRRHGEVSVSDGGCRSALKLRHLSVRATS